MIDDEVHIRAGSQRSELFEELQGLKGDVARPIPPWRHFVASRAAHRDARAIRRVQQRERERGGSEQEREL